MDFLHHKAELYSKKFTSNSDVFLRENELATFANHPKSHMHSGQVQGRFLEEISRMVKPEKILEIGTFTGFSALCLIKGLSADGKLHTIELREEDAATAASYFKKAGVEQQVKLHVGNAMEIIPSLEENWDLIFIDADKLHYIDYYELTLPFLKSGGWILADNVLFHGQVLEEELKGKNALAIQAFNEHVAADNRVEQVLLTIRDGIMLIRKL